LPDAVPVSARPAYIFDQWQRAFCHLILPLKTPFASGQRSNRFNAASDVRGSISKDQPLKIAGQPVVQCLTSCFPIFKEATRTRLNKGVVTVAGEEKRKTEPCLNRVKVNGTGMRPQILSAYPHTVCNFGAAECTCRNLSDATQGECGKVIAIENHRLFSKTGVMGDCWVPPRTRRTTNVSATNRGSLT
jgi:hypothetical protein